MADAATIGIVASEFVPAVGGMEQHALGLSRALTNYYNVTVYTTAEHAGAFYDEDFVVKPVLALALDRDARILASASPDFWLVLNAGYAPLAEVLEQPVFVYCHGNDFLTPWIAPKKTLPVRLMRMFSSIPVLGPYWGHAGWLLRRNTLEKGLRVAAGVYANSIFTRDLLVETFPRSALSAEINTPAVADIFFNDEQSRQSVMPESVARPLRLLTVARLSSAAREKNVDNVIRALTLIPASHDVHLRIAGDGDLRQTLEELTQTLGVAGQVEFFGNIPGSRVRQLLAESDLFVLPSKESFGMAYVEAAACGVPSLVSSIGATDAILDGVTAVTIDGAEPEDIARSIIDFAERRSSFDPAAMRKFAAQFTWTNVASCLVASMERDR